MAQQPSIIAAIVRTTLQDLTQADAGLAERVRAEMQPDLLRVIEKASRLSWLPVEVDVDLTDSLFRVAGAFAAKQTLRNMMTASVASPLMRPVMQTALRMHGSDTGRVVTWAPKLWALVYRHCGEMTVAPDGFGAVLALSDLPEVVCKSPAYLAGTSATIEAIFQTIDVSATVRLDGPHRVQRSARFYLRWLNAATA